MPNDQPTPAALPRADREPTKHDWIRDEYGDIDGRRHGDAMSETVECEEDR